MSVSDEIGSARLAAIRAQVSAVAAGEAESAHVDEAVEFDASAGALKSELVRIVVQYLENEGYVASALTLAEEAGQRTADDAHAVEHRARMRRALLDGDWPVVKQLCGEQPFKHDKAFLFEVYKQSFLELIEAGDHERALKCLNHRLKPLEAHAANANEFKELCYMLTCKSVQQSDAFRHWDGSRGTSRERLVEQFESLLASEQLTSAEARAVPPNRLVTLLRQALAYQVHTSRYHPTLNPTITTLLDDFKCFVVPNAPRHVFRSPGAANVKAIAFVGTAGWRIASAADDNLVCLWDAHGRDLSGLAAADDPPALLSRQASAATSRSIAALSASPATGADATATPPAATAPPPTTGRRVLGEHRARIWQLSSSSDGAVVASASGDGTLKLWNAQAESERLTLASALSGHESDVYTVCFHPDRHHIVSGGYDKTVRLWDTRTGVTHRLLRGHASSVACVLFNPYGNLIFSGSKDSSVKVWDVVSGVCVKTISSHLGEVTSLDVDSHGSLLLTASKDNSNRLWDLRSGKPARRFKGHQNTSKNFVRAAFGPSEKLVVSGSEDGCVYVWDVDTGLMLQRLTGHAGIVYDVKWNERQSLLVSCGDDGSIRTWHFDPSRALFSALDSTS
jgi:COMPASS component SWD3